MSCNSIRCHRHKLFVTFTNGAFTSWCVSARYLSIVNLVAIICQFGYAFRPFIQSLKVVPKISFLCTKGFTKILPFEKFRRLAKICIFDQNYGVWKISMFGQNLYFRPKFVFSTIITILDVWPTFWFLLKILDAWTKFGFSVKMSMFRQHFDFWLKILWLDKLWFFQFLDKNFNLSIFLFFEISIFVSKF